MSKGTNIGKLLIVNNYSKSYICPAGSTIAKIK
jgi:hypothetical protein